jgi:hypothetical protein
MATTTETAHATRLVVADGLQAPPAGPVTAALTFYAPPADGARPFNYVSTPPPGAPQRNYGDDERAVPISDLRGHADLSSFTTDTSGFQPLPHAPTSMKYADWASDETVRGDYYPEVERLLLSSVPGSPKRVFIFDHTIRRTSPGATRGPVRRAHVDQTTESATERVRLHMGAEAPELLAGRVRIVNAWRPLRGPVGAFPLAYADSRTLKDDTMVGVEHRYPDRTGETGGVRFDEGQRWWYWSGMTPEEVVLLQCADLGGVGARTPHTAFVDPRSAPEEGRESIEVRALVFG